MGGRREEGGGRRELAEQLQLHHLERSEVFILREISPGQARPHRETEAEFQF